ncbi:cystathionine beta-lyase STR3 TDEL_0B04660 [Torulaspora delbrueckii]|uniref:Cystathionine beta-lyase n=1 Tax=Torulaspora delbrueckii TaxID=4950 RepID=G8ZPQ1_TORDE|nr:hypothetical protein TDEL_0B04660 [Torulaspora delbrueckii]CCE90595.1 hypothetical protein TDEL_0B04660 [Torulaspora delbrueckii]
MVQSYKPLMSSQLVTNLKIRDKHGASVQPLYLSTTFKVDLDNPESQVFDYSRSGNPTRSLLQYQIGKLYEVPVEHVLAVASGMTALDVILRGLVISSATHVPTIIAGDDLYGGSNRLLAYLESKSHARAVHVDTTDMEKFKAVFGSLDKVDCVLLESPTNPLCKVVDVPQLVAYVKRISPSTVVIVDNTMMSGLQCNPLEYGCDVVYESATKYLNGHHDIMGGIIVGKTAEIAQEIYYVVNATGSGLSPMDSWLLNRGLKTLGVRMYQQQYNSMVIAQWLEESCGFKPTEKNSALKTRYVGLKTNPGFELHRSFNKGPGAVLSFETGSLEHSQRIVASKAFQLFSVTVSFGCVNSLISLPCKMSHASIDPEVRKQREFPEDLIRLCVGIEDVGDLQKDLLYAMIDANVLEVRENGKYIYNKLNGHLGLNTIDDHSSRQHSIYDQFYGKDLIEGDSKMNHRRLKL